MVSASPAECRGVFQIAENMRRLMNDYNSGIRIGNGNPCINLKK